MEGGAWGQVFWAHAPVLLAVLMLEGVHRWVPFPDLLDAVLSEDGAAPAPDMPTGADLAQMMAMAQQLAGPLLAQRMAGAQPRQPDLTVPPWAGEDDQGAAEPAA